MRISSFSGLLWQAWQLQAKQYWPEAKHSQYSFRQRELRQLHDLRSFASLSCPPRPRGAGGVLPLLGSHDGRVKREDSPSAGAAASRPADAMRRRKVERRARLRESLSNAMVRQRRGGKRNLFCERPNYMHMHMNMCMCTERPS